MAHPSKADEVFDVSLKAAYGTPARSANAALSPVWQTTARRPTAAVP